MKMDFSGFIQIAGVVDQQEADLLIDCGVSFIGFPLRLPVNKEDLSEENAAEIIKKISSHVRGIGITYIDRAGEAVEFCSKLGISILQLHGPIDINEIKKLKKLEPDIVLIKSLVVRKNNIDELINDVNEMSPYVDAYITDTYDPLTGASGATGKLHDWEISKSIVKISEKPVILAGGITPKNVYDAVRFVNPSDVDVHTGVEDSNGRKTKELVQLFINEARRAFENNRREI